MPDEYFPDSKEPHLHDHEGGVTFTDTRHKHKDLVAGDPTRKPQLSAVSNDLKGGDDREKKIAAQIKKDYL